MFYSFAKPSDFTGPGKWVRLECLDDNRGNVEYIKFPHPAECPVWFADYCRRTASALCYNSFNVYLGDKFIATTEY